MKLRTKEPTGIMIHCSDCSFGDADLIKKWHMQPPRSWDDIGYNWIITNGIFRSVTAYKKEDDGVIEEGRDTKYIAAHAKGYNESHLGICLIGEHHFTWRQIDSLFKLIMHLRDTNQVAYFTSETKDVSNIILGHYEVDTQGKTCPNISMKWLRKMINLQL